MDQKKSDEIHRDLQEQFAKFKNDRPATEVVSTMTPGEWNETLKKRLAEYEDADLNEVEIESEYDPETKIIKTEIRRKVVGCVTIRQAK